MGPVIKKPSAKLATIKRQPNNKSTKMSKPMAFQKGGSKEAKAVFEKKKAAMGKISGKWPKDCVMDDRHCSWLPVDWTPAIKMTENGLLLFCYIGPQPDRKRFFHKKDVESYLGRKLTLDERGEKARQVPEELLSDFPPSHYLKRSAGCSQTQYIKDRCDQLHGWTIGDALARFMYKDSSGKERHYGITDLRYDLKSDSLEVVAKSPEERHDRRKMSAPATNSRPRWSKEKQDSKKISTPVTNWCQKADPSSVLTHAEKDILTPLLAKGAIGMDGMMAIYSLVGIGFTYGFDPTLLHTLPDVLAKAPSERSQFDSTVLKSLAGEFRKVLSHF